MPDVEVIANEGLDGMFVLSLKEKGVASVRGQFYYSTAFTFCEKNVLTFIRFLNKDSHQGEEDPQTHRNTNSFEETFFQDSRETS